MIEASSLFLSLTYLGIGLFSYVLALVFQGTKMNVLTMLLLAVMVTFLWPVCLVTGIMDQLEDW